MFALVISIAHFFITLVIAYRHILVPKPDTLLCTEKYTVEPLETGTPENRTLETEQYCQF